ncbi:MAG TPA: radical SAM family heme chaperone HemW [Terriglobia bacterium]|nr:radical SAM family heme chaperone HemW [Terriglobia bacterium]
MEHGLYIHIPFCEQRCYYCAFTVAVSPEPTFEPYINRLLREIDLSGFNGGARTVYFGGGTPSLLNAALLGRVLHTLRSVPHEVSIEVNPGTLSDTKIQEYRDLGVSRISLGAQSLEDEDLARAGRLHNANVVFTDFEMLRKHGFRNINLDLIAGLPGQRLETWSRNLDRVLALAPEHISLYMLDHEERSAWSRLPAGIPDENDFADFYTLAESRLESRGYIHYEISNWALPGSECAHNIGYWSGIPYRGFGVGAHSFDGVRRFWNTSSLADYAASVDSGRLPVLDEEVLTPDLQLEEAFMLGLRQARGVDLQAVAHRFGLVYSPEWHDRVRQLEDASWISLNGSILTLTPKGRLAANSVIEELLWPTPSSTAST